MTKTKYQVLVDDNFHYMEEGERYIAGEFNSIEEAIAKCKHIVEDYLASAFKQGMTAEELYDSYTSFGEDPFIRPADGGFSAWDYAKRRCQQIC